MRTLVLLAGPLLALANPAAGQMADHSSHGPAQPASGTAATDAQDHDGHDRHPPPQAGSSCTPEHAAMGHCTLDDGDAASEAADPGQRVGGAQDPPPAPPQPGASPSAETGDPDCPPEHAAMGHCTPRATPAPDGSEMATRPMGPMGSGGTALPAGDAPAPVVDQADYADRIWGREAMAPARAALIREHGGGTWSQVMLNLAEVQIRSGRDGYRWDGEAWFGGDLNRFTLRSEGEGDFGGRVGDAELHALYSRAIGPYFNLQAGIRHDIRPRPSRTYAAFGFEGLAPYWFEVEGTLFLSDKGDVLARLEAYYDQRITQRLVLQPRGEVNLSAQDMVAEGVGSGLSDAEFGLRLRYEIEREFAPYLGLSWERKFGDTARFARADGESTGGFAFVGGIRAWF